MSVGRRIATHRKTVVVVWVIIVILLAVATRLFEHQPRSSFAVPGSESNEALELLQETFPPLADAQVTVVYATSDGSITDSADDQLIQETITRLEAIDEVASVSSPTAVPQRFVDVSSDGTIAYSTLILDSPQQDVPADTFDDLVEAITPARDAGLTVELDGQIIDQQNTPRGGLSDYADLISVVVAIIVITLAFGAPIVSLMPIAVALVALSTSLSLLAFLERWFVIASVNETLGTMLALGVGIDYSLLVINRHRQLLADGTPVLDSIGRSWATAGRSVVLAGATVCGATALLFVIGVPLVTKLGLTTAMFVAVTVIAALTLLPALLGFAGSHLDRWSLPWAGSRSRFWPAWARLNFRGRWPFALVPLLLLAVVFIPVRSADLGIIDDGSLPTSVTQRRAYDLISEGFGPGANGPLVVVAALPSDASTADLAQGALALDQAIRTADGVQSASPPRFSSGVVQEVASEIVAEVTGSTEPTSTSTSSAPSTSEPADAEPGGTTPADGTTSGADGDGAAAEPTTMVFRVIPATPPDDPETADLVHRLRSEVIPQAVGDTVIDADEVFVGGQNAVFIDFTNRIQDRLVLFIGLVLVLAFVLLMSAFRSLLIPVKAAAMALVSFLVAYGATVAVFQWGWMRDVVGLDATVPIETFFPLMLFAILFGLSMDYEVFLVSRIREEHEHGREANDAVTRGLATTGKVILSAGVIMTSVFLAFATNPSPVIKQIAFGLAVAIAVDAIIIRLIVVPALLHLFGRGTWWFPGWLDRVLPKVDLG